MNDRDALIAAVRAQVEKEKAAKAAKLAKERELRTAAIARVLTVFMIIIPMQMNFIVGS